jgi:hypothetical protein
MCAINQSLGKGPFRPAKLLFLAADENGVVNQFHPRPYFLAVIGNHEALAKGKAFRTVARLPRQFWIGRQATVGSGMFGS